MKSIQDLNLMTVPMLEKIHLDLTGNQPKKGLTKSQLVQRVFDLQQADPEPQEKPQEKPEEAKSDEGATPPAENSAADANDFDDLVGGEDDEAEGDDNSADSLSVNDEDLIGEETPQPKLPAKVAVKVSEEQATHDEVRRALAHLPVQVHHDETGITIVHGSKQIYTTIRQPLHVIVATAEAFAGVR